MNPWRLTSSLLLLPVLLGIANAQPAPTGQLRQEVQTLFEKYWDARAMRDQQAGDDHFLRVSATLTDWRYRYAQTLVQVAQYRSVDARENAKRLVQAQPLDWRLRRLYAWACLASRDYDNGLLALDQWVKAQPPPEPGQADLNGLEAAADIGVMLGFLEVAAHKTIDNRTAQRYMNRWSRIFSPERQAAVTKGRQRVVDQHAELLGRRDKKVTDDKEQAEKEKEDKLLSLDRQQDDIRGQDAGLRKRVDSLRDQLKSELAAIEREDAPLRGRAITLETQATAMSRDLAIIVSDIARLERRLALTRDPVRRRLLIAELVRLDEIADRRDAELLVAERQLDAVVGARQLLLRRQRQTQADLGQELRRANEKRDDLQKLDRRLSSQRQRVMRSSPTISGSARAMAARAAIIATYFTFPLAEEKQRLLESL